MPLMIFLLIRWYFCLSLKGEWRREGEGVREREREREVIVVLMNDITTVTCVCHFFPLFILLFS